MAKNRLRDTIVMGFALFAIFFGAGNLIFPPLLGVISGTDWTSSMWGFLTTDPLLPVFGVVATVLAGGSADDLGKRVSPEFAKLIGTLAMLIIGPFFAVPRTASVTANIAIAPLFPGIDFTNSLLAKSVVSLIFFVIVFILIFNQGKVIDIIGKYLTPVLIIVLSIIIIKCIITPIGTIHAPLAEHIGKNGAYFKGFTEGYQTMDALGAGLMAGIVIADMKRRGYNSETERKRLSFGVAIVSCILLALVYGGLTYVGATYSDKLLTGVDLANQEALGTLLNRETILISVAAEILGASASWLLAICVAIACMTTATGLLATAGNFFSENIFKGKISYKIIVSICTLIAFSVSILGTAQIVKIAVPVLFLIYPTFVVLIFLTLFGRFIKHNGVFIGAVLFEIPISIIMALQVLVLNMLRMDMPTWLGTFSDWMAVLPLADKGFPWILPAIVGAMVGLSISMLKGKNKAKKIMS